MKRLIILIFVSLTAVVTMSAQSEMNIAPLFDGRYRANPNVVETIIRGSKLEKYDLSYYHALTVTGDSGFAAQVVPLVTADGSKATDSEVSYRKGQLYYAFYTFTGRNQPQNTYILYLNQWLKGGDKIVLIYMKGEATPSQIKNLFKH